jgi:hypothetical protein
VLSELTFQTSVSDVDYRFKIATNYQHLRKEIVEVQDLQKQLSASLQLQLKLMQAKYNTLKEKIGAASPARLENPSQN